MTSKLFQLATSAAQRAARQRFIRTPVGRVIAKVDRFSRGRGAERKLRNVARRIERIGGSGVLRDIERAGGIEKYALGKQVQKSLDQLFRALGPLGSVLKAVVGSGSKRTVERQLDGAIEFLRAFGHEVIPPRGRSGRDRGVQAAVRALEEEGISVSEPRKVEEFPAEHGIQLLPRPSLPELAPGQAERVAEETLAPQSSNIYSFTFERESRTRGILYVTYRQGKAVSRRRGINSCTGNEYSYGVKPNRKGPTYAYYDVPVAVYQGLKRAASKGTYIWDKIRVCGTVHGHQYSYNLVQGAPQTGGGVFVPRRATPRGFRTRALADPGTGRRGFTQSQLPERLFNNGQPNRGEPDRGEPNRGR